MRKSRRPSFKEWFHLCLVPWLSFSSATVGDVLILGPHFSNNRIHIKVTAVVHLHYNRCILDLSLQLLDFLQYNTTSSKEMGVKIHFNNAFCFTMAHKNKKGFLLHHRSAWESQSHQRVHPVWLPAPPLSCRLYQCPTQHKNEALRIVLLHAALSLRYKWSLWGLTLSKYVKLLENIHRPSLRGQSCSHTHCACWSRPHTWNRRVV